MRTQISSYLIKHDRLIKLSLIAWIYLSCFTACQDEVVYQTRSMSLNLSECISALSIKNQSNLCTQSAFENTDLLNGCVWLKSEDQLFVVPSTLDQNEKITLTSPELLSNVDISVQNFNVAMAFYDGSIDCLRVNANDFCQEQGDQSCVLSQSFKALEKDIANQISVLKNCEWTYHTLKADQKEVICDRLDNDCDGMVDEGQILKAGDLCDNGQKGICLQMGTYQCTSIGEEPTCQAPTAAMMAMMETCNMLDDNCDGIIDNLTEIENCEIGQGECKSIGQKVCQNGMLVCDAVERQRMDTIDLCDSKDNDCDGVTDENFEEKILSCGKGLCENQSISRCENGTLIETCVPLNENRLGDLDEGCDGLDDDCDGVLDENFSPVFSCGEGVCRMDGIIQCQHNEQTELISRCEPGQPFSVLDVICNGLDDDCDGQIDEDFIIMDSQCGLGACSASGEIRCIYGNEIDTCVPDTVPADTFDLCDGIDNDCDGRHDEAHRNEFSNCSVGLCQSLGFIACQNGQIQDTCIAPVAIPNLIDGCDGFDNDCDGRTDENFVSMSTTCGLGICFAQGQTMCMNGNVVDSCEEGMESGISEVICNGLDDNCNGLIDEGFEDIVINCEQGSCGAVGLLSCLNGEEKNTCRLGNPAANDPSCDGDDDDCDGNIDEDYLTSSVSCGQGICQRLGNRSCVQGREINICTPTIPAMGETDQTCNLTDDDCDGNVDEGYQSSSIRCGLGICSKLGLRVCLNGGVVDQCQPDVSNQTDQTCNSLDEDCDGRSDEGYQSQTISCGIGACQANGTTICVNGTIQNYCNPNPAAINDSTCNSIDDDCDGRIDESYVEISIECGNGDCKNTGIRSCSNGVETNRCTPLAVVSGVTDDDCDFRDEDCDGKSDESYLAPSIACGVGACQNQGQLLCVQGTVTNTCAPNNPNVLDNQCDGIDNNCNAQIDEGYVPTASTCGQGVCANTGTFNCMNGQLTNNCVPKSPTSVTEICNLLDDNCNGSIDENLSRSTTCGQGICVNSGTITCNNGSELTTCTPLNPGTELCGDGLDNDCDGRTDEGFANLGTSCSLGQSECTRSGVFVCTSNRLATTCNAVPAQPGIEVCNGIDDDCDLIVDDGLDNLGSCVLGNLQGACKQGTLKCQAGQATCTQSVVETTEVYCPANQVDEDCDGLIDETIYAGQTVQLYKKGPGICNGNNQCYSCGIFDMVQQKWTINNCAKNNCY